MKPQARKQNPIYDPFTDGSRAPIGRLMTGLLSCAGIYLFGLLLWWSL